ncbi:MULTISPECIES: O-acetyl-ADP-ribose deacetylase [Rhodanobacter]|uniref:O-acetyl-ADP-ribose deacetylase n=1 Tax=Rhodanobacter TaxID=75309 RepID=UPI00026106B0|nr:MULTISPECIES: O-acetyl-ADP-ribose deacetylase [Rhodanobacter]EIM03599.1 RNase III inhibitor [Rhodanobacter denitrificans]KZC19211.1 RNase III inhibitor [Rhodanobacter denitrificans]UJJ50492.1 O-acetyl-ADP-ribose deacetylase [Rhodanobacter denitrificans]UJJ57323.1 O-acetyl-ADP-ribose deacetylase [Rhodanobacter denitrificans]UJM91184.1 O-acetyl-ADP-ribose deacetylase [Rhodanobacter denitrificans]
MPIKVIHADITRLAPDAIVNAANSGLLGGGGVDGAIHRTAGPALLKACRALPEIAPGVRCPIGEARITPGFALPARWVIHTVGPVWHGGDEGEAELLARCHRNALRLLRERALRTIAFPAISCGVYGYPAAQAAAVAVATLRDALAAADDDIEVTLCCFSDAMRAVFQQALAP